MHFLSIFGCIQLLLLTNKAWTAAGRRFASKTCKADEREPWSYRGRNGPEHWSETYRNCSGRFQSPIAFSTYDDVIHEPELSQMSLNGYDIVVSNGTVENNGRTIVVTPTDGVQRTIFVHGATYSLTQLHFHWGSVPNYGAEHIIDDFQHSMEMHLVHENSKQQTAVVAVFFQEKKKSNKELQKIVDRFQWITYRNMVTQLKGGINLNNLLPSNPSSYFRYIGSLTTPECNEGVIWSLLTEVLPVGADQMKEFRKLYAVRKLDADYNCKLSDNYRPVQPLKHRHVFLSQ